MKMASYGHTRSQMPHSMQPSMMTNGAPARFLKDRAISDTVRLLSHVSTTNQPSSSEIFVRKHLPPYFSLSGLVK